MGFQAQQGDYLRQILNDEIRLTCFDVSVLAGVKLPSVDLDYAYRGHTNELCPYHINISVSDHQRVCGLGIGLSHGVPKKSGIRFEEGGVDALGEKYPLLEIGSKLCSPEFVVLSFQSAVGDQTQNFARSFQSLQSGQSLREGGDNVYCQSKRRDRER